MAKIKQQIRIGSAVTQYDPCLVQAGEEVFWDGRLTPTQCESFPVGGDYGNPIGRGSFASAYKHRDDPSKVVKFTADKADATASEVVARKPLKGTVRVYEVAKLKGQKAEAPTLTKNASGGLAFENKKNRPVYAIVTEMLNPLSDEQENAVTAFWERYRRSRPLTGGVSPADFRAADYVDFDDAVSSCIIYGGTAESCRYDMADIFASVNEQARWAGIIPLDLPARNWGVRKGRNGNLVILDLGVSAVKKTPRIKTLAGTGAKGKKMAKRKYRRSLGQTDMSVLDPSQPSRVVGINWSNPWVIGGAVAALGLIAWFAFGGKKDKKKPSPTSSGSSAAPASGGGVVLPATASSTTPTAPQRVRAASGDSWSVIAKKYYGDTRWWPALWDANRSGGSKFSDPSLLRVGDEVVVPVLPVTDSAFRAAVFARAKAYQTWYRNTGGTSSRSNPLPSSVSEFTSVPTQNAAAGTQVSSQTAAESSSGQKALPPASSSTPMSAEEKLQSDAEDAWNALDNTEG